jgi:hypothetical protein
VEKSNTHFPITSKSRFFALFPTAPNASLSLTIQRWGEGQGQTKHAFSLNFQTGYYLLPGKIGLFGRFSDFCDGLGPFLSKYAALGVP